ncbi:MAG: molybdate ABC transporter substrate-binding protein [Acidobacteria bacterium]|nr:MAG: molybdate ABC transporter substrate-binding protein [Acidobacteriota bacterium]
MVYRAFSARPLKPLLILPLLLCGALPICAQDELTIAAASDLQPVMKEAGARFEKETGSKVKLVFGSSGDFFAQLQNGAPFDVFLSADVEYPKKLEAAGLTEPGSLYEYATGKIVLWVPNNSPVDVEKGLSTLADVQIHRLAIANPAHAPYGRAAKAALKNAGLWDQVSSKLVLGENISQTAQFANSGNADAAILALSLVLSPAMKDKGKYFEISQEMYPPLRQAAVIVKNSAHTSLAARFLEFLKQPWTRYLFMRYGFMSAKDVR